MRRLGVFCHSLLPLKFLLAVVIVFCGQCVNVVGWGRDGHESIGMTTMSAISSATSVHLKKLLGDKDVFDVSYWAHLVNEKHPDTTALHYQFQNDLQRDKIETLCPDSKCLLPALNYFYGRLVGASEVPKISFSEGVSFTDADSLKYLINLIADMHQPLHLGRASDSGGKFVLTSYFSSVENNSVKSTLFDLWENDIISKIIAERPHFWNSGWTHVNFLRKGLAESELARWESTPTTNRTLVFEEWAKESANFAISHCYKNGAIESGYQMTQTDSLMAFEFMRQRILLAGLRTALVVNSIISERDSTKLRRGTALNVGEKILKQPDPSTNPTDSVWWHNLLLNFLVISVLVTILLIFIRIDRGRENTITSVRKPRASAVAKFSDKDY